MPTKSRKSRASRGSSSPRSNCVSGGGARVVRDTRKSRQSKAKGRVVAPRVVRDTRKSRKSRVMRVVQKRDEEGPATRVARKSRISKRGLIKYAKASNDMTIIELQKMAREQGIPFGGLSKSKLMRKINKYLEAYY